MSNLSNAINIVEKALDKATAFHYTQTEMFASALREVINAARKYNASNTDEMNN